MSLPDPHYADATNTLYVGDCLDVLAGMDECSVDAVVTDPPYGLEFMGQEWDAPWKGDRSAATAGMAKPGIGERERGWPSNYGGLNPKCQACTRWQRGANPCRCESPDFPNERAERGLAFQRWCEQWAAECLRVLKPGGHLLSFGGSRTYHRLACAVEDAGFEVRDQLQWLYGAGFPKSLSPYRSMMGALCRYHEHAPHVVPISPSHQAASNGGEARTALALVEMHPEGDLGLLIPTGREGDSAAATVIGPSALKAANINLSTESSWRRTSDVLLNGTSTSITETVTRAITALRTLRCYPSLTTPPTTIQDASRPDGCECPAYPVVESLKDSGPGWSASRILTAPEPASTLLAGLKGLGTAAKPAHEPIVLARKPLAGTVAGNVTQHGTGAINVDGCRLGMSEEDREKFRRGSEAWHDMAQRRGEGKKPADVYGTYGIPDPQDPHPGGRWPANVTLGCACEGEHDRGCAVAMLDQQSGTITDRNGGTGGWRESYVSGTREADTETPTYRGEGGASRFFYCAKASRAERDAANSHPTVKPVELMRWLVRLVTPPGGLVLDPFAGSGTTGIAATVENKRCVMVERDPDYADIAVRRLSKPLEPTLDFGGAA